MSYTINMKKRGLIITICILLVALGSGYFIYSYNNSDVVKEEERFNERGVTFNVEELESECTNKYFYQQLNEDEKLYYLALLNSSKNNSPDIEWTFFPDSQILQKAKRAFIEDWPLYFFWNYASFIFTDKVVVNNKMGQEFIYYVSTPENAENYNLGSSILQIEEIGEKVAKDAYDDDPYVYVKNIHDYVTNSIVYTNDTGNQQTLYGALIDKKCVCEGYARAFQYLCNKAGFECISVDGLAKFALDANNPNIAHEWNMININDNWYQVDCTWDDSDSEEPRYCWFLLNDDTMGIDHSITTSTKFEFPTCDDEINFHVDSPVACFDSFDKNEIQKQFYEWFKKGENSLTIRFVDKKDYQNAITWLVDNYGAFDIYNSYYTSSPIDYHEYVYDDTSHYICIYY